MEKYDIVIVSHEKDFNKIKYVVEYADRNLDGFESIHLILTNHPFDELDVVKSKTTKPVIVHYEQDVIKMDLNRISHRPNWIYQMILKMFQNVTKNDHFLILESDGVVNSKLNFFEDDKTIIYLGVNHNRHDPYFKFNQLINIENRYPHSLVSEVMMYDKKYTKEILQNCGCNDVYDFIEKYIYPSVSNECYPADYEVYGQFLYNYHPDKITFKKYKYSLYGVYYNKISDHDIETVLQRSKDSDYISFHTWL